MKIKEVASKIESNQADQLAIVKRRHNFVCEALNTMNDCFGFTLLLSVMFYFITNINSAFYMFSDTVEGITFMDISFAIMGVGHLMAICCAVDFITDQVVK